MTFIQVGSNTASYLEKKKEEHSTLIKICGYTYIYISYEKKKKTVINVHVLYTDIMSYTLINLPFPT